MRKGETKMERSCGCRGTIFNETRMQTNLEPMTHILNCACIETTQSLIHAIACAQRMSVQENTRVRVFCSQKTAVLLPKITFYHRMRRFFMPHCLRVVG